MRFWDHLYQPDAKPGTFIIPILASPSWIQLLPARMSTSRELYIQLSAQTVDIILTWYNASLEGGLRTSWAKCTSQILIQTITPLQGDLCIRL